MKVSMPVSNNFCPQTLFLYGTYREDGTANFGLFCWISYCWDTELGVMACIGGEKLTRDRIRAAGVFSASLVTEAILPLADYFGNVQGYEQGKTVPGVSVSRGNVLPVPVLDASPVTFELETTGSKLLDDSEVFFCKIRNVLGDAALGDPATSLGQKMNDTAPVSTTCSQYFSWDGKPLGAWGEPMRLLHTQP